MEPAGPAEADEQVAGGAPAEHGEARAGAASEARAQARSEEALGEPVPEEVAASTASAGPADEGATPVVPLRISTPDEQMEYPREDPPSAELVATVSSGEGTELPHWADPPTGEVPRAFAEQHGSDEEMQAWRLLGSRGLHWRDDVNDWADSPGVEDLVGANDEPVTPPPPSKGGPFSFDEDFERLERERGRTGRGTPGEERSEPEPLTGRTGGIPGEYQNEDTVFAAPPHGRPAGVPPETVAAPVLPEARAATSEGVAGKQPRARLPKGPRRRGGDEQGAQATPVASSMSSNDEASTVTNWAPTNRAERPYDVAAEVKASDSRGRDIGPAVLTGAILAVLLAVCYVAGPAALVGLSAVVLLGCALEAFAMLQRVGFRPATLIGGLGAAGTVLAAYWKGPGALGVIFATVLAASLLWYLFRVVDARPVVNVAVTFLGYSWVGALGGFAGLLLQAPYGKHLFLGAVIPTVVCDIGAWLAGSFFGSHHLAPHISPGKTWEGFVGGGIVAVIAGAVIGKELTPWGGAVHGIELGVLVAIVAPIGDLVQSMVKRDLRLKDSGALLPGHGGLLDRFDSMLFVLPATYFLVAALHLL